MGNERGTRTSGTASTTTAATATTTSSDTCREPASTGQEDTRTWRTSAAIVAAAAGYTTAVASGAKSKFLYAVQLHIIVHQLCFFPQTIICCLCNSRRRLGQEVHHRRQLLGQTLRKGQTYNNKQGATQQHRATTQTKQGASHGAVLLWEATKRRVSNEGMSFAISTNSWCNLI